MVERNGGIREGVLEYIRQQGWQGMSRKKVWEPLTQAMNEAEAANYTVHTSKLYDWYNKGS